ncbi:MAG: hypothetical protein QOJ29_4716, partial [Thermoleophilaceae bacterium]|nr:hypothetical protein [Thermoleophilaceae bacterium]
HAAAAPEFAQQPAISGSGEAGDRLTCSWSFTNPQDVTGQEAEMVAVKDGNVVAVLANGSSSPMTYTPLGDEGSVGCQVRAIGRAEGDADPPTTEASSPLRKVVRPLAIAGRGMKPQTLTEIERKGFTVEGECNRACALTLKVVLAAADARRLGLGTEPTTIASGRGPTKTGKSSVTARVKHLAALNKAGFVRITLFLSGIGTDGKPAPAIVVTKMKIRFHP